MTDDVETLEQQVNRLARWILDNVESEPSQSQGAIDTAIRMLDAAYGPRSAE